VKLIAGDTTKTVLSATFFYLSRNPNSYRKLTQEIRSIFKNGSEIRGPGLAQCGYLRACIDEAMRMSPPAPGILWRELASDVKDGQPFIVDGHVIPRGTVVGVNTYSVHHNEEYFPDSFAFRPERWLAPSTDEARQLMREAFAPFSLGPRGCAGKSMAYLETSLVLAKTLWYFDFEAAPGELGNVGAGSPSLEEGRRKPGEFQLLDIFGSGHDGPYLTFKARSGLWQDLGE
jgi:cytochrome P450